MIPVFEAIDFLRAQSSGSLVALYWYVLLFEVPRYTIPFAMAALLPRRARPMADYAGRVSVVVAGHSEADVIEACILGLREQSRPPDEIVVVSDGSSDGMAKRIGQMQRDGLIDAAHATDLRSGKAAGANMAVRLCTGQVVINLDCDSSLDRHAIRNILRPLADPAVGAVAGNILVRNGKASLLSAFQCIEYAVTISLAKQAEDRLDQVTCVSGAFGAFRRSAFEAVGGLDAGGGEDLDLTLALRRAGWKIRFAENSRCYTDVPATRAVLVKQRFRWERDAVRLRYRKHRNLLNPFTRGFRLSEALHEIEFLVFNVVAAAVLPFYLLWLLASYGTSGLVVLLAAQLGLVALDCVVFLMAAAATPAIGAGRLLLYVPGYSIYYGSYMRFVRLSAYGQEWIFRSSYHDSFVPDKVQRVRG